MKMEKKTKQRILVAALMAFAWVSYSGIYHYKNNEYMFFGISMLPLVLWTAGLVTYKIICGKLNGKHRFWKSLAVWIGGLIIIEYVGYHIMNIQLASNYSGIFGLDVCHVPAFAKIFYLSAGPIYLKITDYLEVK